MGEGSHFTLICALSKYLEIWQQRRGPSSTVVTSPDSSLALFSAPTLPTTAFLQTSSSQPWFHRGENPGSRRPHPHPSARVRRPSLLRSLILVVFSSSPWVAVAAAAESHTPAAPPVLYLEGVGRREKDPGGGASVTHGVQCYTHAIMLPHLIKLV